MEASKEKESYILDGSITVELYDIIPLGFKSNYERVSYIEHLCRTVFTCSQVNQISGILTNLQHLTNVERS